MRRSCILFVRNKAKRRSSDGKKTRRGPRARNSGAAQRMALAVKFFCVFGKLLRDLVSWK